MENMIVFRTISGIKPLFPIQDCFLKSKSQNNWNRIDRHTYGPAGTSSIKHLPSEWTCKIDATSVHIKIQTQLTSTRKIRVSNVFHLIV